DLLVEVLSTGTTRRDRGEKLRLYAESGVREYWIVDVEERQIEFLVQQEGSMVVALPVAGRYRSSALPEVEIDLEAFWERLDRRLRRSS
ncbi:MAG TPA: Uma2 family endonuclease, partial [Thermoanaerobaculia bacterium]|nr:Uma2 family endonuclease [Thermoanaerobaculia bacterium]